MALATRLQKPVEETTAVDITKNLLTLQFESALTEGEKELQYLRKRAHALTVNSCAQAAFLVSILNEARSGACFLIGCPMIFMFWKLPSLLLEPFHYVVNL